VSDAVHERLREQILSGRLRAGDALPAERALSEQFEVNRHAVREAIKRLQQAGLVQVAQGGATRVCDWSASGGLELLADLGSLSGGGARQEVLRAMAEMRSCIGADAARLCARRAEASLREDIRELAAAVGRPGSYDERLVRYESLWEQILAGAQNVAYRLSFNTLVDARHGHGVDPRLYAAELDDARAVQRLADAVAAGDEAAAERRARALLDRALEAVSR
jgi:DNA-binding FadR family transcriptional regulator